VARPWRTRHDHRARRRCDALSRRHTGAERRDDDDDDWDDDWDDDDRRRPPLDRYGKPYKKKSATKRILGELFNF